MKHEEMVKRFDELEAMAEQIKVTTSPERMILQESTRHLVGNFSRVPVPVKIPASSFFSEADCLPWAMEASAAIDDAFPEHSSTRQNWSKIFDATRGAGNHFHQLKPAFKGAASLVRKGHLRSLVEGVRAETVVELLEQAEFLIAKDATVAAAVVSGGALETHLRHLVERHQLAFKGDGSISAYNDAIGQARNQETVEVYSKGDSTQVTAWGQIRNDAAHQPTRFDKSKEQVSLMIQGIRLFIQRVP